MECAIVNDRAPRPARAAQRPKMAASMPNTAIQTTVSGWRQLSARPTSVAARFRRLADRWAVETENVSSIDDMIVHPAYQEIIRMGPAIIPLLIDDIERNQNHWFCALHSISGGQNPVPPEHAGDVDKMTEAWINWAKTNGYR
jgi:hypothetical protein